MHEFYTIHARKISKILDFFYDFCPKSARILHNNCPKNIFPFFFFGGGGAPSPTPMKMSSDVGLFSDPEILSPAHLVSVASIQIYFEGAKFFAHMEGDEARGPKAESGGGVLGEEAASPLPHQLRGLGSAISSPSGVRADGGKFEILCNLRPQNSLQKCLMMCKLLLKG